jgi:hypothetical protein
MDPDVFQRNTFFSTVGGSLIFATAIYSMNPSFMQRYTAIETFKDAIKYVAHLCNYYYMIP